MPQPNEGTTMLERLREANQDPRQRYDAISLVLAMAADRRCIETLQVLRPQIDHAVADLLDPSAILTTQEEHELLTEYHELSRCLDMVERWVMPMAMPAQPIVA